MLSLHKTLSAAAFIACCSFSICATAQNNIIHTIKQGETLSALAKQYNTTVGDIMRLNGMNSTSKLQIGQGVKIPANGSVKAPVTAIEAPKKEVVKPVEVSPKKPETSITQTDVTYTVLKGQSLYGIAKQFKTTEAQIIAWNNLPNDKIKAGQTIIVGKEILEKSTIPVTPKPQIAKPVEDKPVVTAPVTQQPSKNDELTVLNAGSAKVTPPVENKPAVTPAKDIIKLEPAPIPSSAKHVETEGFFAGYFNYKDKNVTTATGDAAVFKTTSGWTDKKYYVLMNEANQGDIVRLTANNKTICAKVLGPLPAIKEDNGLLLRLSNAAAAVLGVEDTKFNVTVSY